MRLILLASAVLLILVIPAESRSDDSLTLARLSTFISSAGGYLTRISHTPTQDPDHPGKFTYIAYLDRHLPLNFADAKLTEYNLLRHNGAIYSLALLHQRSPKEEYVEVMKRAVTYLKNEAMGPVPAEKAKMTDDDFVFEKKPHVPNLLAAWETPATTTSESSPKAKLGGAGLALVALVSLERVVPGTTSLEYMRQLAEFIHYMQKPDGSFVCRYRPAIGGKDDSWVSLYYPGEAALGLLYLVSIETDNALREKWLKIATKALLYLARFRRNKDIEDVQMDHWALIASSKLLPLLNPKTTDYWLIYQHAIKVIYSMLNGDVEDGGPCSTGSILEGLVNALSFVKPEELYVVDNTVRVVPLRKRMLSYIQEGVDMIMDSQETDTSRNMHGGIPKAYDPTTHDSKEVRVDHVQHTVSALIAFESFLLNDKTSSKRKRRLMGHAPSLSSQYWVGYTILLVAAMGIIVAKLRKPKKMRVQ